MMLKRKRVVVDITRGPYRLEPDLSLVGKHGELIGVVGSPEDVTTPQDHRNAKALREIWTMIGVLREVVRMNDLPYGTNTHREKLHRVATKAQRSLKRAGFDV